MPSPLQKGSKDWEVLIRLLAFPHDPTNLEATQPISLSLGSVPTPQTFDFNQPTSQPPIGFSAQDDSFQHDPTIYDLAFFDLNQPTEKLAEDLSSAAQDPVNLDELVARTIDPYSDENLEVPLKNPVPNPADDQVASAPVQYGFIMTQSDEPNNNEVPVTSPSLPAPVKRRGRKKDSLELKAIKAQIKNDEKQKAAQRIKELKKR